MILPQMSPELWQETPGQVISKTRKNLEDILVENQRHNTTL